MTRQRTLKNPIEATGVGLHSGEKIHLRLHPAPADTGIIFRRTDFETPVEINASPTSVGDTRLSTSLSNQDVSISTVEHLMSALAGFGVDNAYVDVDAPEVPIMDGSASTFVFMLKSAGFEELSAPKRYIRIQKTVEVEDGDKWAKLEPYDGFRAVFDIEFDHPAFEGDVRSQSVEFSSVRYEKEISRARTFGFMRDVEILQANGLALGASLDNAVGLDESRVMNEDGLRFEDEFVRHKILDAIGDLYLLGNPVLGAYHGYKSGHALNNQLTRKLLSMKDAWEYVTFEDDEEAPMTFASAMTY